jgi:hypothetical protein
MTIFIVAHSRICFRIVLNFYKKSNIYEVLNAAPFFCYQFLVYPFWLFNHCHFGILVKTLKSCPPSQISWLFFKDFVNCSDGHESCGHIIELLVEHLKNTYENVYFVYIFYYFAYYICSWLVTLLSFFWCFLFLSYLDKIFEINFDPMMRLYFIFCCNYYFS